MNTDGRTARHQRNTTLEDLLTGLNSDLGLIGDAGLEGFDAPTQPTVFLVGCARSGTTLALQWLSGLGAFSWPSNFISRFHAAPWVGQRVQMMLTDPAYDFRGELTLETATDPAPFTSRLGKTRGLLAPNEFWYWWRRFLPEGPTHCLSDDQLAQVDAHRMAAELAAWQDVTGRPLAMKALIMNWNLPWLAAAVPGSVFLHVTRDPFLNAQSLLESRRDFHGDDTAWYSFRPAEYAELKDLPPVEQVAGQIRCTDAAIAAGLSAIAPHRQLKVAYEDLCADPRRVYADVRRVLADGGCDLPADYPGPKFFPVSQKVRLSDVEQTALRAALDADPVRA